MGASTQQLNYTWKRPRAEVSSVHEFNWYAQGYDAGVAYAQGYDAGVAIAQACDAAVAIARNKFKLPPAPPPTRTTTALPPVIHENTTALPTVIQENMWLLRQSRLPGFALDDLVNGASAVEIETEHQTSLSNTALQVFLDLWCRVRERSAEPALSVTPDGSVVAEWVKSNEMSLAIMTNDSGVLYYSLFNRDIIIEDYKPREEISDLIRIIDSDADSPFSWSDPGE